MDVRMQPVIVTAAKQPTESTGEREPERTIVHFAAEFPKPAVE